MERKTKSIVVWAMISILTLCLHVLGDLETYPSRALPFIWGGFSWNLIAYGTDKGMWPRGFEELDGGGKGNAQAREIMFWTTTAIYLGLLATLALVE
jgi:hypothetical protein